MVTAQTTHPDSWCITNVNECFQPNVQMQTFISNLEATTHQVYSMSTIVASATDSLTPPAIPDVMHKAHMSHLHECAILMDMEHTTVTAQKKRVQALQKAEQDHLEANSSNTTGGCNNSGCTGGWRGNSSGHNNDQGCGHGG